jgi:hypothetical protein
MSATLEVPLRFSDMAVGDLNPFSFDFISPPPGSPPGTQGWTTALDPVVSATVVTSSPTQLMVVGNPGVQNSVVTFWLGGGCAHSEYKIFCRVMTQFGRTATRTAHLYVSGVLPN